MGAGRIILTINKALFVDFRQAAHSPFFSRLIDDAAVSFVFIADLFDDLPGEGGK